MFLAVKYLTRVYKMMFCPWGAFDGTSEYFVTGFSILGSNAKWVFRVDKLQVGVTQLGAAENLNFSNSAFM